MSDRYINPSDYVNSSELFEFEVLIHSDKVRQFNNHLKAYHTFSHVKKQAELFLRLYGSEVLTKSGLIQEEVEIIYNSLWGSILSGYARNFNSKENQLKLDKDKVFKNALPDKLPFHDELMNMRNFDVAHHSESERETSFTKLRINQIKTSDTGVTRIVTLNPTYTKVLVPGKQTFMNVIAIVEFILHYLTPKIDVLRELVMFDVRPKNLIQLIEDHNAEVVRRHPSSLLTALERWETDELIKDFPGGFTAQDLNDSAKFQQFGNMLEKKGLSVRPDFLRGYILSKLKKL